MGGTKRKGISNQSSHLDRKESKTVQAEGFRWRIFLFCEGWVSCYLLLARAKVLRATTGDSSECCDLDVGVFDWGRGNDEQ